MDLTPPSDGRQPEADAESDTDERDDLDPEAVQRAIRIHAERIEQRELKQAMDRLDADESLTPAERQIIEEMADSILDELLAVPEAVLAAADDEETLRTVVELFDPTE